jgi:hypothetical protein
MVIGTDTVNNSASRRALHPKAGTDFAHPSREVGSNRPLAVPAPTPFDA